MEAADSKLLVLGAGIFQVDLIRAALALGARVITLDNVPGNVGHGLSHDQVVCSTVDVAGVLAAAREYGVDGVASAASDAAVPALAVVRSELGLPGAFSPDLAVTMSNKAAFRRTQREAGLTAPEFEAGSDAAALTARASRLRGPLMVKPAHSSGSRGITKVAASVDLSDAVREALRTSRDDGAVIEETVPGTEFGGDAFVKAGQIVELVVTDKFLQGFAVAGHFVPDAPRADLSDPIREELARTCEALGYQEGPLNFDLIMGPGGTTVLEVGARTGGNGIPVVALRARGVDFHGLAVRQSLGLPLESAPPAVLHAAGASIVATSRPGVVGRLPGLEEVQKRFDDVWDLRWTVSRGDLVAPRTDSDSMLGLVLFDCDDRSAYEEECSALRRWVDEEIVRAPHS